MSIKIKHDFELAREDYQVQLLAEDTQKSALWKVYFNACQSSDIHTLQKMASVLGIEIDFEKMSTFKYNEVSYFVSGQQNLFDPRLFAFMFSAYVSKWDLDGSDVISAICMEAVRNGISVSQTITIRGVQVALKNLFVDGISMSSVLRVGCRAAFVKNKYKSYLGDGIYPAMEYFDRMPIPLQEKYIAAMYSKNTSFSGTKNENSLSRIDKVLDVLKKKQPEEVLTKLKAAAICRECQASTEMGVSDYYSAFDTAGDLLARAREKLESDSATADMLAEQNAATAKMLVERADSAYGAEVARIGKVTGLTNIKRGETLELLAGLGLELAKEINLERILSYEADDFEEEPEGFAYEEIPDVDDFDYNALVEKIQNEDYGDEESASGDSEVGEDPEDLEEGDQVNGDDLDDV